MNTQTTEPPSFTVVRFGPGSLSCILDGCPLREPPGLLAERYALRRLNLGFIRTHGDLTEADFRKMREVKDAVEAARAFPGGNPRPLPGDTVQGAYYDGALPFTHGMLDTPYHWRPKGELTLCTAPYTPFTELSKVREEGYILSMSGGPFFQMNPSDLEAAGTDERLFSVWGHSGPSADGNIRFPAKVNRWVTRAGVRI